MIIDWKPFRGYENLYLISNNGVVHSLISNKILKNNLSTSGYYFVNIYKEKKGKPKFIHHMIAESFLGHSINRFKFVIDHKDNNKLNNNIDNIQIITNRHNSIKDKNPKSGYSCIYKNNSSWIIRMRVLGKKVTIGTLKDIQEAKIYRDMFIKDLDSALSIPEIQEKIKEYKQKIKLCHIQKNI
jgi:hypothetical protein